MNKVVQSTVQFILALGISSKAGYVSLVCSIALHLSTVTLFHMVHLEAFSKSQWTTHPPVWSSLFRWIKVQSGLTEENLSNVCIWGFAAAVLSLRCPICDDSEISGTISKQWQYERRDCNKSRCDWYNAGRHNNPPVDYFVVNKTFLLVYGGHVSNPSSR